MITKKLFIDTMEQLEKLDKQMDKVDNAFRELMPDFGGFYIPQIFSIVVRLLEKGLNDKGELISYLAFERNWLHDFAIGDIYYEGHPVDLSDWGKVYDFLT